MTFVTIRQLGAHDNSNTNFLDDIMNSFATVQDKPQIYGKIMKFKVINLASVFVRSTL